MLINLNIALDPAIPAGAQGATGDKRSTGAQGTVGLNGAQGATGDKGSPGAQGTAGLNGAQGARGDKGSTGSQGATGTGLQGAQGATGAQGSSGDGKSVPGTFRSGKELTELGNLISIAFSGSDISWRFTNNTVLTRDVTNTLGLIPF